MFYDLFSFHTVGLTSIVSSILILLSQVFITATQEEIFSQRPVLVDLSKNYYVMPLKSRVRKRFSKGFYLSFDVQRAFVKNCLYFL
jgi:ABC-type microcin C transport system permease subunit YejE